jgi:hypothetical protein
MLAKRLTRRGVAMSGGAFATVIAQQTVSGGVPISVVFATIKAASLLAEGNASAAGAISVKVAALTEGVLRAMMMTKLKAAAAVVLALGLMVTGAGVLTGRMAPAQGSQAPAKAPPQPQQGPDVLGSQDVLAGQNDKKSHHGDDSKAEQRVAFDLRDETWSRILEKVTDITGLPLVSSIPPPRAKFTHVGPKGRLYSIPEVFEIVNSGLAPHELKLIRLEKSNVLTLVPLKKKSEPEPGVLEGPDVLPGQPDKKSHEKEKQEKEAFTAWGKEIGGLQAGLGFRPGAKRAYHYGETLTLVIRVRNVGKETVKFSYLMPYIEHETFVTNGDGKRVPQPTEARLYSIGARIPGQVELEPGKEIELHELKRECKPASESGSMRSRPEGHPHAFYGTGKVSVQYEQVFGNPAIGHPGWKLDPALSKLATGMLELEIKSDPPPAESGKETPGKKVRDDASAKPIKVRVYIERVNEDTCTITASCMLIGEFDNVTKPLRLENLRVSEKATIMDRDKELKLTDLKLLPRDTHFYLSLKAYEEELGFEVVGIETIRK